MRFKFIKPFSLIIIFLFIIINVFLRLSIPFSESKTYSQPFKNPVIRQPIRHINKMVTIIIRGFEMYENDITLTAYSFMNIYPYVQLFILYDELPYPPLDIMLMNNTLPNVKFINLSPSLKKSFYDQYPIGQIKTKYVLFVPDSTRITSRQMLQIMLNQVDKLPGNIVAASVGNYRKELECLRININIQQWTLKYNIINGLECDGVLGKHVLLLETEFLKRLSNIFLLPFPQSLYIQTSVLQIKVKIIKNLSFNEGKPILKSHHAQWRQKQIENQRFRNLYEIFQIRQVIRETGVTEWYGCTRESRRCFGTVIDSMPSYLYEKKWTPPCCLLNLKKTARHVFSMLNEAGIRYWLEAGSLLGAMRSGDVLPWDHDVDIGFIREDLNRCDWLKKAKDKSVVDAEGYLWEKATEGYFFRVHFSKINRIHVNLFPFYSKNGTMVRDSWFTSHKNMEFPEIFLHPMSSIEFIGSTVPSPNNIRDFLELKYGRGAIENPEYPDSSKIGFP